MRSRIEIAEELLGERLADGIYAQCPGVDLHNGKTSSRDFRVTLDGAPTAYCFHNSCANVVEEFNKRLRREIWREEQGDSPATRGSWGAGVASEPKRDVKARPDIDRNMVLKATRGVPAVDSAWLARRSLVDLDSVKTPGDFLGHIFRPEERVLIFTSQMSQGDFAWSGGKTYRLSQERGVKGRLSALPAGAPEGVWYLVQSVTGQWVVQPRSQYDGQTKRRTVESRYTRRSWPNVTSWRHFVLESDELEPELWLRVLAGLSFPIVAVYTSGGRSIHALVRWEVSCKAEWDAVRNQLRQLVCPLGADGAALSAVRLSRLPGCKRGEKLQKLLYLNPAVKPGESIMMLPERR